jgi:hypothetical protein
MTSKYPIDGNRPTSSAGQAVHGLVRGTNSWRIALILVAVVSLTVSLATRYYIVTGSDSQTTSVLKSNSTDGKRQHLLNDGLHWTAPVTMVSVFRPRRIFIAAPLAVLPATVLCPEHCLYNRPPPSC